MKPAPSDGDGTLTRAPTSRLVGVDVARALALIAMMSVHILPEFDARGQLTPAFIVSAGRASALFALLAGVGLSLATGGHTPRLRPRRAVAAAVLTRAGLVALTGLVLGTLSPPVAVILTNYGVLFVVALAVLGLRPRWLLALAAAWVVITPLLSHALRTGLPRGPGAQPSLILLAEPVELVRALALTGYYPVLQWTAYVMVGVAVGRLALGSAGTSARLVAVGLALAVGSRLVSDQLLARGGLAALRAAGPADLVPAGPTGAAIDRLQLVGQYGVPPPTTWWWQAVASPHTGTPFDLAHTIGSALAVLGVTLLLAHAVNSAGRRAVTGARPVAPLMMRRVLRGPLAVLAATGSMTLTIYTVHVVALVAKVGPDQRPQLLLAHVAAAAVLATIWRSSFGRGPLEELVSRAAAAARRAATPSAH